MRYSALLLLFACSVGPALAGHPDPDPFEAPAIAEAVPENPVNAPDLALRLDARCDLFELAERTAPVPEGTGAPLAVSTAAENDDRIEVSPVARTDGFDFERWSTATEAPNLLAGDDCDRPAPCTAARSGKFSGADA